MMSDVEHLFMCLFAICIDHRNCPYWPLLPLEMTQLCLWSVFLIKSISYLSLCLSLTSFCEKTSRTWVSLSPETGCLTSVKSGLESHSGFWPGSSSGLWVHVPSELHGFKWIGWGLRRPCVLVIIAICSGFRFLLQMLNLPRGRQWWAQGARGQGVGRVSAAKSLAWAQRCSQCLRSTAVSSKCCFAMSRCRWGSYRDCPMLWVCTEALRSSRLPCLWVSSPCQGASSAILPVSCLKGHTIRLLYDKARAFVLVPSCKSQSNFYTSYLKNLTYKYLEFLDLLMRCYL